MNGCQACIAIESIFAHTFQRCRNRNTGNFCTSKGKGADAGHTFRNDQVFHLLPVHIEVLGIVQRIWGLSHKTCLAPSGHVVDMDSIQIITVTKGTVSASCNCWRDGHTGHTATFSKSVLPNTAQSFRQGDGSQTLTAIERVILNVCHSVRNYQVVNLFAVEEQVIGFKQGIYIQR